MINSNDAFRAAMETLAHLGRTLLDDDAHDFGYYEYSNRYGHQDHPSPLHHWQYGAILIFIAESIKKLIEFLNMLGISIQDVFKRMNFNWQDIFEPKKLLDKLFNPKKPGDANF